MGTFLTETAVRKRMIDQLEEGEELQAVARGTDLLARPHFAARTDRRGILIRFTKSYEVKDREVIPLKKLDRKLRRYALGKGLIMAPPGEPAFKSEREKEVFDAAMESLGRRLEEGESVMTMGMARDPGREDPKYYYLAFTDRRFLMAKLSGNRDIYMVDAIPLDELESYELMSEDVSIPIDIPLITGQEEKLVVKRKDGQERTFLLTDLFGSRRGDAPEK